MRNVSLDELDRDGEVHKLSDEQAVLLTESRLVDVRRLADDQYLLLPNGRVGAVAFEDLQVEVRPKHKLGIANLMFMLGYAKDPGFRPDSVTAASHGELWPAMAQSLVSAAEQALKLGLLQGYRTEQEALLTVRGRIAFEEQIRRRPGTLVPIEVRYDEFSTDIAENQILLAAIHRMLGVPRIREDTRRQLLHLCARFEGVLRLAPGAPLPSWRRSRLNERYHGALGLAEVLLSSASARTSTSGVQMSSFVVVMWKVFEDFVVTALREALATCPGYSKPHLSAFLTGTGDWSEGVAGTKPEDPHGDVSMDVDLVHLDFPRQPRAVFDAKYKLAAPKGDYANADHYQMLAYCTALKVPTAWLVYAGGGSDVRRRVKHSKIDVVAAPLDLSKPPDQVLARVREIADSAMTEVPYAGP